MAHGGWLLLVEDDATTRELLSILLSREGWQVQEAGSGEQALAMLQGNPGGQDVVLCDQRLPALCGAALASAIRARYSQTESPVLLAMTATVGAAADGYDALLLKPFDASEVRVAYERLRHGQASHMEAPPGDAAPQASAAVLDEAVFLKLESSMGLRGARDLYAFALADSEDRIRHLQQAIAAQDDVRFRSEAHAMKGSCGMIGARLLASLASSAETAGLSDDAFAEHAKVREMHLAIQQIRLMLETLLPL